MRRKRKHSFRKYSHRQQGVFLENKRFCLIVCHIEILFIFDTAEFSQRENFVEAIVVADLVISFGWSLTTHEDQSSISNKLPQM